MTSLLSADAIGSLDWLFEQAIRDHCGQGPDDRCEIQIASDAGPQMDASTSELILANISSYSFRIVVLFNFGDDEATALRFAGLPASATVMARQPMLIDAYSELVNMICGAVNRGLRNEFRHVALSTPFVLESSCARFVSSLNCAHTRAIRVTVNGTAKINICIGICVARDTTLDFRLHATQTQDETHGELELF